MSCCLQVAAHVHNLVDGKNKFGSNLFKPMYDLGKTEWESRIIVVPFQNALRTKICGSTYPYAAHRGSCQTRHKVFLSKGSVSTSAPSGRSWQWKKRVLFGAVVMLGDGEEWMPYVMVCTYNAIR